MHDPSFDVFARFLGRPVMGLTAVDGRAGGDVGVQGVIMVHNKIN